MSVRPITVCLLLAVCLAGCKRDKKPAGDLDAAMGPPAKAEVVDTTPPEKIPPVGDIWVVKAPLGLPPLPVPDNDPVTADLAELGRKLFYDESIPADGATSCAVCHDPDLWFTDGRGLPLGVTGAPGMRNTPSLLNSGYWTSLNWDGGVVAKNPLGPLEAQVRFPLEDPTQMSVSPDELEKRLNVSDTYHLGFQRAFGRTVQVKYLLAARALAAFERTLVSGNSAFDQYYFGHDDTALSAAAKHGWAVFRDPKKGNCIACHTVEEKFALFTDQKFHNLGVGLDSSGEGGDQGRFKVTHNDADRGAFRTPSLRNASKTPPYMHDGSIRTLRSVVDFYADGGNVNPHIDPLIKHLTLDEDERKDLVTFLESLSGGMPSNVGRMSNMAKPGSGLP